MVDKNHNFRKTTTRAEQFIFRFTLFRYCRVHYIDFVDF